ERGWSPFVSMQNHYNLVYREEEREMIPLCRDLGVALIPWSPLARGFLAGNRKRDDQSADLDNSATSRAKTDDIALRYYYNDADFAVVEALRAVAQSKGISNAQVAYAWLLHKGVTAPIVGTSKLAQLDEAVAAVTVRLTDEEIAALDGAYQPHPVIGHA
ncbi:MAG: aldo/keto reductase, partial [Herminiimonas sp.]|nr:aldo/keto reductase [Herminiimonas sp.]